MRELYNAYSLILIPFAMLCFIKIQSGQWEDIIMSTDWSVASFIIFAQSLGAVTRAIVKSNKNTNADVLTTYIIKVLFFGVMPSLYFYFRMHTDPVFWAAYGQIIMFIYASWRFFVDGRKVTMLSNQKSIS
ncbi:MAG: hypothetical protein HRU40_20965 [Saprospiraceae bacterium]|nr:hypothetical protein [Saprospiraceae bacterium]